MGYRNYFGRILKSDFDKEKLKDIEYRYEHTERLFELGKDVNYDFEIKKFFDYNDYDTEYAIIELNTILQFVEDYRKRYVKYLERMIKPEEELSEDDKYILKYDGNTLKGFIDSEIRNWKNAESLVYNIKKDDETIVKSWSYNYEIFELLRIYKTFDEENYYLVWIGG